MYLTSNYIPGTYPELDTVINHLEKAYEQNSIDWCIAGGAIRTYLEKLDRPESKTNSKDFDVFVFSNSDTLIAKKVDYQINNPAKEDTHLSIQLMIGTHKNCMHVVSDFDFICCMAYYHKGQIVQHQLTAEDIKMRQLNFNSIRFPCTLLRRIQTYALKGYFVTPASAETLIEALQMSDPDTTDYRFTIHDIPDYDWRAYHDNDAVPQLEF
jgi:hypothetical protein